VKHSHEVTGCAQSGPDGLQLTNESDKRTYRLAGKVAGINAGERVRVSGKKSGKKSASPELLVEKVEKQLGHCEAASGTR
jgi:hypothetical protein